MSAFASSSSTFPSAWSARRGGERIRITDRGRPKALLSPIPSSAAIERGIAEGWIRPGEDRPPQAVQRTRSRRGVAELLREDRDGR